MYLNFRDSRALHRDREPRWARPLSDAWVSFPWRYQECLTSILLIGKLTHVLSWGHSQRGARLAKTSLLLWVSLLLLQLLLLLLPLLLLDTFKSCSSSREDDGSGGGGGGGGNSIDGGGGGGGGGGSELFSKRPGLAGSYCTLGGIWKKETILIN